MVDNIKSGAEIKKKGGTEFCVFCFSIQKSYSWAMAVAVELFFRNP